VSLPRLSSSHTRNGSEYKYKGGQGRESTHSLQILISLLTPPFRLPNLLAIQQCSAMRRRGHEEVVLIDPDSDANKDGELPNRSFPERTKSPNFVFLSPSLHVIPSGCAPR
jgi:hypothetical protein